jgi:hypothetical protein
MRSLSLLLLALACGAADAKLPTNAEKAVDVYEASVAKIQAEATKKVNAEAGKLKAALEKEMMAETKKGNLEGANAIQARIKEIKIEDVIGNKPEATINVEKLKAYTEAQWKEFPGKIYEVSNSRVNTGVEIKDGESAYILPNPTDTWCSGKGYPNTGYKGLVSMPMYGVPYMALMWYVDTQRGSVDPAVPVTFSGSIILQPNDNQMEDNTGKIRVKIHVQKN